MSKTVDAHEEHLTWMNMLERTVVQDMREYLSQYDQQHNTVPVTNG